MNKTEALKQIAAALAPKFEALNAEMLADSLAWAEARIKAMAELRKSEEFRGLHYSVQYARLFEVCGGKTWFKAFNGRPWADVAEFITRDCAARAERRDALIAKKLAAAEVESVESVEVIGTVDGFRGMFALKTSKGPKLATIKVIYAGGYNIQRLHERVLVNVK